MNEFLFDIPAVPLGIVALLNFFAPYAASFPINPNWSTGQKKVAAIVVAVAVAGIALLIAWGLGFELPAWPILLILGVLVSQTAYDLVHKKTADKLTASKGNGTDA